MTAQAFADRLNEQIAYEFAASQQYVAIAVHYDAETLPRLAAYFYAQALEERNHAMMMVQFLLDAGVDPVIATGDDPKTQFGDIVEPVALALDQERRVTDQINELAGLAREHGDYAGEQFMQWFIKEQVEEVASMSALLTVVERSRENPMLAEEYLAREGAGPSATTRPRRRPPAGRSSSVGAGSASGGSARRWTARACARPRPGRRPRHRPAGGRRRGLEPRSQRSWWKRPPSQATVAAVSPVACRTVTRLPCSRRASSSATSTQWVDGSVLPLVLFLLPDRGAGLDLVDDLAGAREGLAAVRRRRGDDH